MDNACRVLDGTESGGAFEALPRCRCALDIGGTLAKVVFLTDALHLEHAFESPSSGFFDSGLDLDVSSELLPPYLVKEFKIERSHVYLKFGHFLTSDISRLVDWLSETRLVVKGFRLPVTGGGAFKFEDLLRSRLGVTIVRKDEMASAMIGLSFLLSQPSEVKRYNKDNCGGTVNVTVSLPLYPFLLINIGSGVSILKAEGPGQFKRVTGTCIGGGTVLGLARLLIGVKTFHELMDLSRNGTHTLDLNVADLYGDTAGSQCLPGNTLASSFGSLYVDADRTWADLGHIRKEDVARSLIHMVSYNLGYLAYLIGVIHKVHRFFFAGKFINNHDATMEAISDGVQFYASHYSSSIAVMGRSLTTNPLASHREPQGGEKYRAQLSDETADPPVGKCPSPRIEGVCGASTGLLRNAVDLACPKNDSLVSERKKGGVISPLFGAPEGLPVSSESTAMEKRRAESGALHGVGIDATNGAGPSDSGQVVPLVSPPSIPGSKSELFEVLFLKHDGYLGALGAFLQKCDDGHTPAQST